MFLKLAKDKLYHDQHLEDAFLLCAIKVFGYLHYQANGFLD
jgi:hypothetical protein